MVIPFTFDLHVADDLTRNEEAEARTHAADANALGIDLDLAEGWLDAPFPEVVAHLLMFDPRWLLARRWAAGWVVEPATT